MNGKVAMLTGAARERGIGLATAKLLVAHGARVAVLDLDEEDLRTAGKTLGSDHLAVRCDVTDPAACQAAVTEVIRRFGRIDVLINNAGLTQRRRVMEVSPEDFELVTNVVLRGALYMSQAVIPSMKEHGGGSIVCVSSMSAQQGGGVFGGTHYCAAKAGVLGLAKAMAKELGPDNIRVNSITPGLIDTDFSRGANPESAKFELAKSFPLRRIGQPIDIAGVCLFLASELSSFMTGATLDVNGGAHIH
ncbi:MAG TPA: SDR family NAD(P)-dependent oxidoreductase [Burkholderiaceae bacterium]|nr:SDR family NAD(P)-dependent oxidoreductase [Burkholderiaceae bacterium]